VRSLTKDDADELVDDELVDELLDELESNGGGGGGGGGADNWLSIDCASDVAVDVSPDWTADTRFCRSPRKPELALEPVDDELEELDDELEAVRLDNSLSRLVAALCAEVVSPFRTDASRVCTLSAKLSVDEEVDEDEVAEVAEVALAVEDRESRPGCQA
jgi:hypothetical protein